MQTGVNEGLRTEERMTPQCDERPQPVDDADGVGEGEPVRSDCTNCPSIQPSEKPWSVRILPCLP